MDLYLVRHAIAEPRDGNRWSDDSQRPLTPDGSERFRAESRGLRRIGVSVEALLSSSHVRAWQTAEILTEEAGWPSAQRCVELEPPSSSSACLEVVGARSESSLALVGHEPNLSELASLLLSGSENALRLELKKGGVILLHSLGRPVAGTGILRWSLSPKILRRLGR